MVDGKRNTKLIDWLHGLTYSDMPIYHDIRQIATFGHLQIIKRHLPVQYDDSKITVYLKKYKRKSIVLEMDTHDVIKTNNLDEYELSDIPDTDWQKWEIEFEKKVIKTLRFFNLLKDFSEPTPIHRLKCLITKSRTNLPGEVTFNDLIDTQKLSGRIFRITKEDKKIIEAKFYFNRKNIYLPEGDDWDESEILHWWLNH